MCSNRSYRVGRSRGFTLIELMVTIVVATILITIAVPAYTSQMRKSRRTEARTALLELAAREQRFYSTNSTYSKTTSDLGYSGSFPQTVGSGYYQINVTAASANGFTLQAVPQGPQASDSECGTFTLDNTGAETISGTGSATTCWD